MSDVNPESQPYQPTIDRPLSCWQDFDHEPADNELARFVHPDGSAAWLRVVETPRELPGKGQKKVSGTNGTALRNWLFRHML